MQARTHDKELLRSIEAQWEGVTIANDFVFGKVMLDEDLCKDVLEAILGVPIDRIEYVGRQDDLDETPEGKGVRLDAYVRDASGTVYDVEMQATNTRELPQRSRYYHAMLTFEQLGKGQPHRNLRSSYVIFICTFDLFGLGSRVYSFESRSDDGRLALGDGVHTIFLAATSPTEPARGERVNELLDYVARGEVSGELSMRLDEAVARVRNNQKWRLEYYLYALENELGITTRASSAKQKVRDQLNFDKGFEQGLQEGREAGLREATQSTGLKPKE